MKKLSIILGALCILASCAKEQEPLAPSGSETEVQQGQISLTLTRSAVDTKVSATNGDKAISYKWEEGDKVNVLYTRSNQLFYTTLTLTEENIINDTTAIFVATESDGNTHLAAVSRPVAVVYPGVETTDDYGLYHDFTKQSGKFDDLSKYFIFSTYMADTIICNKGVFRYSENGQVGSNLVKLRPQNLIFKLAAGTKLASDFGSETLKSITIGSEQYTFGDKAYFGLSGATMHNTGSRSLTITPAENAVKNSKLENDIYISMLAPNSMEHHPEKLYITFNNGTKDFQYEVKLGYNAIYNGKAYVLPTDFSDSKYARTSIDYGNETVTLMLYGVGGDNLDYSEDRLIYTSLKRLYDKGLLTADSKKVNITCQFKYSNSKSHTFEKSETASGVFGKSGCTYRYKIDMSQTNPWKNMVNTTSQDDIAGCLDSYKTDDSDMSEASTLTNFLKWSIEQAPADHYVLVIGNHGGGYNPIEEAVNKAIKTKSSVATKGVMYDDNSFGRWGTLNGEIYMLTTNGLTVKNMREGIENSGVSLDVIHLNLCLTNMLEDIAELQSCAKYIVGSIHTTRSADYSHATLAEDILRYGLDDGVKQFGEWMLENMPQASGTPENIKDICVTKTANFGNVLTAVKDFATALIANAPTEATGDAFTRYKTALSHAYTPSYDDQIKASYDCPFFDMGTLMQGFSMEFKDELEGVFKNCYSAYLTATDPRNEASAVVFNGCYSSVFNNANYVDNLCTTYTVNVVQNGEWSRDLINYDKTQTSNSNVVELCTFKPDGTMTVFGKEGTGYWGGTMASTYETTKFHTATNWGTWLRKNICAMEGLSSYDKQDFSYTDNHEGEDLTNVTFDD